MNTSQNGEQGWLTAPRWTWFVGVSVLVCLVLASLWLYRVLLDHQLGTISRHLETVAASLEADILRGAEQQARIQARMAMRLAHDGAVDPDAWRDDVRRLISDHPFYRAVAVVERDLTTRWLEASGPIPLSEGQPFPTTTDYRQLLTELTANTGTIVARPFWLPDEVPGVTFFTPITRGDEIEAFLAAVMVIPGAVEHMLSGFYLEDVALRAQFQENLIYLLGTSADTWPDTGWNQRFRIDLDADQASMEFMLELHPRALAQLRSALPETVLAAGLLLSLLFTTAVLMAFGASGQARVLARANRRLEDEIRDRELAEQELEFLATHDPLTGLPNRTGVTRHVEKMLESVAEGENLALLFMDLDQFKDINDTLGHHLGDQLLRQIPERLSRILNDDDFVGRHGGDEFLIAVSRKNRDQILQLAKNILESMDDGFALEGSRFFITGSIGIAFYPESGNTVSELIQNADAAVFRAKQSGRNQFALFTPELFGQVEYRLNLSRDIRQALEADQFKVVYQPIVSLEDFSLCGLEALLRWQHEKGYTVPPQEFIRIAEETGSIHRLSQFALGKALADLASWRKLVDQPPWLAVNISGAQFREAGFVEQISILLHQHKLEPELVHLEITEQVLIENLTRNQNLLRQLDKIGMRIVVDDFGVGYSSLAYLKNFPVSVVKIDQGFIRDLEIDREDQAITRTICNLARELGMQTVAEGIEHEKQLELLRRFGCQLGQGFLFSRPVDADAVSTILRGELPWRDLLVIANPPP